MRGGRRFAPKTTDIAYDQRVVEEDHGRDHRGGRPVEIQEAQPALGSKGENGKQHQQRPLGEQRNEMSARRAR